MRFGILGATGHGGQFKSRLESFGDLVWALDSESDYRDASLPDWVFICTPNVLHYEQAAYFLEKGCNVFLEKPPTLSIASLRRLIDKSVEFSSRLYLSDIFLNRSDLRKKLLVDGDNIFSWTKPTGNDDSSLLFRFTYHHLQLIYRSVGSAHPEIKIETDEITSLYDFSLKITVDGYTCRLEYKSQPDMESRHIAYGEVVSIDSSSPDALTKTVAKALDDDLDLAENHSVSLWVMMCLQKIREQCFPSVSVIGGGIFGCSAAIEMASRGINVRLHERKSSLMSEASAINQYRVHRGYHYPRSVETSRECRDFSVQFEKQFRQAIMRSDTKHYYAIASNDSLTSAQEYIEFLDELALDYEIVESLPNTDLTVKVSERLYDPMILKKLVENRLTGAGVEVLLDDDVSRDTLGAQGFKVAATYANLNQWADAPEIYQYELCEKPVFRLPEQYRSKSIVVMDGPFMCIDPLGSSGTHVMGNVKHAIHSSNIGVAPIIPPGYENLINKGVIKDPDCSKVDLFIDSAKAFFLGIEEAEYLGSMFTFRAVKPFREHDDARPTLVDFVEPNTATIFSGKICTCVKAATQVADLIIDKFSD